MEYIAKTKGKSSSPEAIKIMKKYEPRHSDGFGGIVNFQGMTPEDAMKLVAMGAMDPAETQNASPSIHEFIQMSQKFPGMTFHGYRVYPDRNDERISIEGFNVPSQSVSRQALIELAKLGPDELDEQNGVLRAWWD